MKAVALDVYQRCILIRILSNPDFDHCALTKILHRPFVLIHPQCVAMPTRYAVFCSQMKSVTMETGKSPAGI